MKRLSSSVEISHKLLEERVELGDIAIDATAGNGNDTVFLAELTGDEGLVYSFDIQQKAIDNTFDKIKKKNFENRVKLIKDGHEKMDLYIDSNNKVTGVIFNLGYLPGGDHSIYTRPDTTITAIKKALNLLSVDGVIVLVIYSGGDTGFVEKNKVLKFLKDLNSDKYCVLLHELINMPNYPPVIACIERII